MLEIEQIMGWIDDLIISPASIAAVIGSFRSGFYQRKNEENTWRDR